VFRGRPGPERAASATGGASDAFRHRREVLASDINGLRGLVPLVVERRSGCGGDDAQAGSIQRKQADRGVCRPVPANVNRRRDGGTPEPRKEFVPDRCGLCRIVRVVREIALLKCRLSRTHRKKKRRDDLARLSVTGRRKDEMRNAMLVQTSGGWRMHP